jgi:hypothetical protein
MPEASSSCTFPSKYGAGNITAPNYISEIMCERLALKDGIASLPHKFWSIPRWKKIYLQQILAANSLLKIYSPTAIINTLKKNPRCYSLRAKWLEDIFKAEQEEVDKKNKKMLEAIEKEEKKKEEVEEEVVIINSKPRESFTNGKSTISKLRDLD